MYKLKYLIDNITDEQEKRSGLIYSRRSFLISIPALLAAPKFVQLPSGLLAPKQVIISPLVGEFYKLDVRKPFQPTGLVEVDGHLRAATLDEITAYVEKRIADNDHTEVAWKRIKAVLKSQDEDEWKRNLYGRS